MNETSRSSGSEGIPIDFLAKTGGKKGGQDAVVEAKDPLCLLMYQFARRSFE